MAYQKIEFIDEIYGAPPTEKHADQAQIESHTRAMS